jgi:hypothetical protein
MPIGATAYQASIREYPGRNEYLASGVGDGEPTALFLWRAAWAWFDLRGLSCGVQGAGPEYEVCPDSQYSGQEHVVREAVKRKSSEIGFLAVILENTSGKTRSLEFHFREMV